MATFALTKDRLWVCSSPNLPKAGAKTRKQIYNIDENSNKLIYKAFQVDFVPLDSQVKVADISICNYF